MKIREALLCIAWMGCDMIWCVIVRIRSYYLSQVLVTYVCHVDVVHALGSLITLKPSQSWLGAVGYIHRLLEVVNPYMLRYIVSHIAPLKNIGTVHS